MLEIHGLACNLSYLLLGQEHSQRESYGVVVHSHYPRPPVTSAAHHYDVWSERQVQADHGYILALMIERKSVLLGQLFELRQIGCQPLDQACLRCRGDEGQQYLVQVQVSVNVGTGQMEQQPLRQVSLERTLEHTPDGSFGL